jgi:hypothetical protein
MARAPKPSQALQKLQRLRPEIGETFETLEDASQHSDREAALVATAVLEKTLEEAIASHFVADLPPEHERAIFDGDYERDGVVGSLYAKAHLAYALGLFGPDTRADVSAIRWIRNTFAHAPVALTFSTPEIAVLCEFSVIARFRKNNLTVSELPTARRRFLATNYFYCLLFAAEGKGIRRIRHPHWMSELEVGRVADLLS